MPNPKSSSGRLGEVQGMNHDQDMILPTSDSLVSYIAWRGGRSNLCTQP